MAALTVLKRVVVRVAEKEWRTEPYSASQMGSMTAEKKVVPLAEY